MTTSEPTLELNDLGKSYGSKQVLKGVHLALRPGSICCILGRNGAGKTTTIQLIMGHLHPTRGEVRILGKDVRLPESHEVWRNVGYVPDQPMLYDHLTGREFLHFIGEIYGVARTELVALDEEFSALGLKPYMDNSLCLAICCASSTRNESGSPSMPDPHGSFCGGGELAVRGAKTFIAAAIAATSIL
jgi:ABC-2 type transport system ATP-binding protein